MLYYTEYPNDLVGTLTLVSDGEALTASWFARDRFSTVENNRDNLERRDDLPVFDVARAWFDDYFAGKRPDIARVPLAPQGSEFRQKVWLELRKIPYGQTVTYGDIAKELAKTSGKKVSAQAVGGAVGHNPLGIIVPCHRVMGAKGNLTGFGGGIQAKIDLLEHEKVDMEGFFVPKKGTAL